MACEQWGHQWQKGVEVGGEVDIHICDHRSAALEPRLPQCATPTFLLEVQGAHAIQLFDELAHDGPRVVVAGIVDHRNNPRKRELLCEITVKPVD